MRLLLCNRDGQPQAPWLAALRAALPGLQIDEWQPGLPPGYDVAAVWNAPQQLFDEQPQLRLAFNLAAGVDKLLALRLPPGLAIARLQDAGMAVQMAEYVCHALIGFYRGFDRYAAQQRAGLWQPHPPAPRADFPVGILGLGTLGVRVAEAVRGFEFPVLGWSRQPRTLAGVQTLAGEAQLPDFLRATRVLVCLLPLTPATRGLLRRDTLGLLRPGGYLINIARGGHLVEDDLLALLREGHLAGATLDVTEQEPLPPGHPFWHTPGITLTPHIAGHTLRDEAVAQLAAAVRALQAGAPVAGLVEPARGY